ncbi:MAG: TerB N-terminal domain-containing protein [Clostridia bacterium]|nr:TerB N-terminal domain-containing protein [Clostridia bacterium]
MENYNSDKKNNGIRQNNDSVDDFWDISYLAPAKKRSRPVPSEHITPSEIEIGLPAVQTENDDTTNQKTEKIPERTSGEPSSLTQHNVIKSKKNVPEQEYSPENSLIHKVRIYGWHTNYSYYEQFCKTAQRVSGIEGKEVPYVPFFSYMPQYSQLTEAQFEYYLWIRTAVRKGLAPCADYSYILLYLYELINLSDMTPPEKTLNDMTDVWLAYRESFPRLDVQIAEWLCDFCLINHIDPPYKKLGKISSDIFKNASLKEFYIDTSGDGSVYARLLMKYCSNYDFCKSKFASGGNADLYRKHGEGVIAAALAGDKDGTRPFLSAGLQDSRTVRDSYTGALCSPRIKKRIEIEYCSFSHSHELRFIITDLLKYSENRIRAYLGIKSKLSCPGLNADLKKTADRYFDSVLPVKSRTPAENVPAYEKYYEPQKSELTFEAASKIEELSWETTEKLVDAFTDSDKKDEIYSVNETGNISDNISHDILKNIAPIVKNVGNEDFSYTGAGSGFTPDEIRFLCAALENNRAEQERLSVIMGKLTDAAADSINEKAVEILGDIILEDSGNGYCVIDDYIEDVRSIIG